MSPLLEGAFLITHAATLGAIAAVWLPFHAKTLKVDPFFRAWIHMSDAILVSLGALAMDAGAPIPAIRVSRLDALAALR